MPETHGRKCSITLIPFVQSVYFIDCERGYAVGDSGTILATTDSGNTWVKEPSWTHRNLEDVYCIDTGTGYIVGDNGVVLKHGNGVITNIKMQHDLVGEKENAVQFRLIHNNHQSGLAIQWILNKPMRIGFRIFSIHGKLLYNFPSTTYTSGKHRIQCNDVGLGAGLYVFNAHAGNTTVTKLFSF